MAPRRLAFAVALIAAIRPAFAAQSVFVSEPTHIRNGWSTFPVLTRGEAVPLLDGTAGQLFPWTDAQRQWDGLGACLIDPDTVEVFINHETSGGGTISRLHLGRNALRQWIAGRVVGNTNANQTARPAGLIEGVGPAWTTVGAGTGLLDRPCSANLWEPHAFGYERGFHDRLYLSGEETFGDGGHFRVIDPASNTLYAAADVGGGGSWESATLIDTGRTDTVALLLGEDQGDSPLGTGRMSLYVGRKNPTGSFLERNGLAGGTTYYWDADGSDSTVGTLFGPLFPSGNGARAAGTWTTDPAEAVLFSKAEDVHVDQRPSSPGFGTRAAYACQGQGVFLVDFSGLDFVAGDLGPRRHSDVTLLYAAGTDAGDGSGATGLFDAMDNVVWSADGNLYVNEDDGEGDIWEITVDALLSDYAAGTRTPRGDRVFQILDADPITGLGINESSGIIDISLLVGYQPGSVFLTNGMGSINDQMAMLVSPTATLLPSVIAIDVASGTSTQRQSGVPILSGTTAVQKTGQGTLVLDQVNLLTGSLTVQAGAVALANAEAARSATLIPLAGGTISVAPHLFVTAAAIDLRGGGLLDVGSGGLTVAGGLPAAAIPGLILAGRGDGAWSGTAGITSSEAAVTARRTVGWLEHADGSITVGFAAAGDTNLDWSIDQLDLADFVAAGRFDSGSLANWQQGDFTADGLVDILDAAAFIGTDLYDQGPYNSLTASSLTAVPEPSSTPLAICLLAAATAAVSARRSGGRRPSGPVPRRASTAQPSRAHRAPAAP